MLGGHSQMNSNSRQLLQCSMKLILSFDNVMVTGWIDV
jgi:hypothetical protein